MRAIPAWAGKPFVTTVTTILGGGHPRVGGETAKPGGLIGRSAGPSPRGRGNLAKLHRPPVGSGAIPAWAGKPAGAVPHCRAQAGHPRVGGETSGGASNSSIFQGPSPRGRGNRMRTKKIGILPRAIPAWAGKPG